MQTPEKLTLIGGSILFASTLIFTLKSQASHILPRVDSGMTNLFKSDKDRQVDQEQQEFDSNYQQAQQKHWQTGTWGSAKYYIDGGMNLHVGSGQLQGALEDTLGHDKLQQIQTINLDGPAQAPQNSQDLFGLENGSGENIITQINGLANLDTSQVTDMEDMFAYDETLSNLDVSHFNTSNVTNVNRMFYKNEDLTHLNLSSFNTSNVTDMGYMFYEDGYLINLNLSSFNTSNVTNMYDMFEDANIENLTLGPSIGLQNNNSNPNYNVGLSGNYQSNGQTLSLDGNAHPGTWTQQ